MGNNIICHLLSTSYILGVSFFFLHTAILSLFSQNCIVTFYTEVIGMSQTRQREWGGERPRGVEKHKECVS